MSGTNKKRILIIGAGYVGLPLAQQLTKNGHDVTAVKYSPITVPEKLKIVNFDIREKTAWEQSDVVNTKPYDCIFYMPAPNERAELAYKEIYISAFDHLCDLLETHGQKNTKVVFVSSTAVYPHDSAEVVTELSEAGGSSTNSEILAAAEKNVQQRLSNTVIARFGGLYGPDRFIYLRNLRELLPRDDNHTWVNLLHLTDAINALEFLAMHSYAGGIINVSGKPAVRRDILVFLAGFASFTDTSAESLAKATTGKKVDSSKLTDLGFNFIYHTVFSGYNSLFEKYGV